MDLHGVAWDQSCPRHYCHMHPKSPSWLVCGFIAPFAFEDIAGKYEICPHAVLQRSHVLLFFCLHMHPFGFCDAGASFSIGSITEDEVLHTELLVTFCDAQENNAMTCNAVDLC